MKGNLRGNREVRRTERAKGREEQVPTGTTCTWNGLDYTRCGAIQAPKSGRIAGLSAPRSGFGLRKRVRPKPARERGGGARGRRALEFVYTGV